jgi:sugar lactone lactonase YvrE
MKLPLLFRTLVGLALGGAAWSPCAFAQFNFTTYAGVAGQPGASDGAALSANFDNPTGIVRDAAGNVYVASTSGQTIRKIAANGTVTTLAGSHGQIGSADGTGAAARFSYPWGLAIDPAGNIYVADSGNHTIRKITPQGVVSTLAGVAGMADWVDGTGVAARFNHPSSLAVDTEGNVYVSDYANSVIRKVTPAGVVTTLAGTPGVFGHADGVGSAARFNYPDGLDVDDLGNVYVCDANNHVVRKIAPNGTVTTIAGTPNVAGMRDSIDGPALFDGPVGVVVEPQGSLLITDRGNHLIRRISLGGWVTTVGGQAGQSGTMDGPGTAARFSFLTGIVGDASGNIWVTDTFSHTVRRGGTAFLPDDYLVRPVVFNADLMRQRYPALAAFPDDDDLWAYFLVSGIYEGMHDTDFLPREYLASRPAKAQLYGTDWAAAAVGWYAHAHAPTASFTLSPSRALGDRIEVTVTVGDEDENYSFANLWVRTPNRGWLAIRADSSVVESAQLSAANSVANSVGTHTRNFTFSPSDGEGVYTFALAAVDRHGLRTNTPNQAVSVQANRAPTASLSVAGATQMNGTITVTVSVGDPDMNYSYANLWVRTPNRGWLAIRADNSVVQSDQLLAANSVATTAGTHTRSFTFTPTDGAGTYTFALAAVDAQGARTNAANQTVVVTSGSPPAASFSVAGSTQMNGTMTLTVNVSDADGDYSYANLWVRTPNRGWLAIRADNSVVQSDQLLAANSVATTAGTHTRSFTFTPTDGAGTYTFALAAVDAQGARTNAANQTVVVGP